MIETDPVGTPPVELSRPDALPPQPFALAPRSRKHRGSDLRRRQDRKECYESAVSPESLPTSASALRNRGPIGDVLERMLPVRETLLLEIASGSGEHAAYLAERLAHLVVQPSDRSAQACACIDTRASARTSGRLEPAICLDVLQRPWPVKHADAVLCINMLHASPPETLPALMQGAAAILGIGSPLITYGPYRIDGKHTAPSNEVFDTWLRRERDSRWGVRDLETVVAEAERAGFVLEERVPMPSNNFILLFHRVAGQQREPTTHVDVNR